MLTPTIKCILTISLLATLAACATTSTKPASMTAAAQPRSADAILADIEAVKFPEPDPDAEHDAEAMKNLRAKWDAAAARKAELVHELHKAHPDHERLPRLLHERWASMIWTPDPQLEALEAELAQAIARDGDGEIANLARFIKVQMTFRETLYTPEPDVDAALAAVETFIASAPHDSRGAQLLLQIARSYDDGSAQQIALYQRIINDYPDDRNATFAKGLLRQASAIGKPFELAFTCAVTGTQIDVAAMRGRVVVVDFWATWCGPCVAKMPKYKEMYAKYHDHGLEIVGVSLDQPEDQGGLERMLTFIEENELPWPQYYQGRGWESEFSMSWGVGAIPTTFIIDAKGNLHTAMVGGATEEMIAELLGVPLDEAEHAG